MPGIGTRNLIDTFDWQPRDDFDWQLHSSVSENSLQNDDVLVFIRLDHVITSNLCVPYCNSKIIRKKQNLKQGNVSMTGHHTTWNSSVEAKQYHIRNSSVGGETIYHNNCFLFQKCTSYQVLSSLFMFETEVQLIREKNPTIHVFNKSYLKIEFTISYLKAGICKEELSLSNPC